MSLARAASQTSRHENLEEMIMDTPTWGPKQVRILSRSAHKAGAAEIRQTLYWVKKIHDGPKHGRERRDTIGWASAVSSDVVNFVCCLFL